MLFDTPLYLLFLLVIVTAYWRLGFRRQNVLLLIASYFFYGWWDWRFLGLIAISTVVDYFCALAIADSIDPIKRKLLLTISVSINLGFLGYFKYFGFFSQSLHTALAAFGIQVPQLVLDVLLPPGISFYTFQALAYIVDVYFERMKPSKDLIDYALFICLFPHLIAGPIQRPSHLLPQTQHPRHFDGEQFFSGLQLIFWGLFRKCVVADSLGLLANAAFGGRLGKASLPTLLLGTYAFAWQIYGDFSGYSDIARGSAQLLGFHFMVNFRQPYLSCSLQEFWRRWHISLSTWFRDYLFVPLALTKTASRFENISLVESIVVIVTFVVSGLWHGANWTFLVWGFIHGFGLAMEQLMLRAKWLRIAKQSEGLLLSSRRAWLKRIFVFHLVGLALVFFRASSVSAAFQFLRGATVWNWQPEYGSAIVYLAFFSLPLFFLDLALESRQEEYLFEHTAGWHIRVTAAVAASVGTLLFSANQASAFIYFQF